MESIKRKAKGQLFITGLSNKYDDEYPYELEGLISKAKWDRCIKRINDAVASYWPCKLCFFGFGWGCCLCSFGLSLLIPNICIRDAQNAVEQEIKSINALPIFADQNIRLELKQSICSSYLSITYDLNEANKDDAKYL